MPDASEVQPVTGVDVIMSAADEAVQVCFEGAGAFVGPYGGEVGGGLAVEEAEFAQISGGQGFETGCFDLLDQGFKPVPTFFSERDPVI